MIISNSHKFVFIHIHKCAGTSITKALDPVLVWNDVICGSTQYGARVNNAFYKRFKLHKHSLAHEVRDTIGPEKWASYFTFTFVRHPFSRAVSLYTYIDKLVKQQGFNRQLRLLKRPQRRKEIWRWSLTQAYLESRNFSDFIRHRGFQEDISARPQFFWIADHEKKTPIVNFIGKVETLHQDFETITTQLELGDLALGQHNLSTKTPQSWQSYYQSEQDYDVIRKLHAVDFEKLGYEHWV
ncbi:MAG: sulfotransferase family 2 domain-containing protein [Cyanobacteria bacterium J06632_22]